jgi:hypothetical protein
MSIESRLTGTGPMSSTIAPMEVDLVGPGGVFGRLKLPEIKTKSGGTTVQVHDQNIEITDMEAFKAFVKSLMGDKSLLLKLANGKTTVKAFMMKTSMLYAKDIHLTGMDGLKSIITDVDINGDGAFTSTVKVRNPSPVELDLGTTKQDIFNAGGEKIAEQGGKMYLLRGDSSYKMKGRVTGRITEETATILGTGVEEDTWLDQVLAYYQGPVTLPRALISAT